MLLLTGPFGPLVCVFEGLFLVLMILMMAIIQQRSFVTAALQDTRLMSPVSRFKDVL